MWTTLALVAALGTAPGQAGSLALTNDRPTYGILGAPREDTKFLPGDMFFLAFDIENIKVDDTGKVLYSMGMDVTDSKGKSLYRQEPRDLEALNSLGGTRLPAYAHVFIGLDQPPGEYTLKLSVTDRATKASRSLERKFQVVPLDFGITRLTTSLDPQEQIPAPMGGVAGQSLFVNFVAVGFERDRAKRQANLNVEMRVLDEDGKPTLAKPFTGSAGRDVDPKDKHVPMQFVLALNRAGRFTVEIRAADKVSGKKAQVSFPLTVTSTTPK
jgi:hypothetical protein